VDNEYISAMNNDKQQYISESVLVVPICIVCGVKLIWNYRNSSEQ